MKLIFSRSSKGTAFPFFLLRRHHRCDERRAFKIENLERRLLNSAIPGLVYNSTTPSISLPGDGAVSVDPYVLYQVVDGGHVDVYNSADNNWSVHTLSIARQGIISGITDDQVVFDGGGYLNGQGDEIDTAADIFDASTDQWSVATLPQPQAAAATCSVGSQIFFAGGYTDVVTGSDPIAINAINIYDSVRKRWSSTTLSQGRAGIAAVSVDGYAIFAGGDTGFQDTPTVSNVVDLYDSSTGQWTTATLSQARAGIVATTIGDLAIFAGGVTNNGESNAVDIFNAKTGRWSTTMLSVARSGMAVTTVDGLVIFAGGANSSGSSSAVDIYNPVSGRWSTASLSQGRYQLAAATVGNLALFVGGSLSSGASDVVDIYNASTNQWSTSTINQTVFYNPTTLAQSVGSMAIFAGGQSDISGASPEVDTFMGIPVLGGNIRGPKRGSAMVTIDNSGEADLGGHYIVSVYASMSRTIGSDAVFLGKVEVRQSLKINRSTQVTISLSIPQGTTPGQYHLIALAGPKHQLVQIASTRHTFAITSTPSLVRPVATMNLFNANSPINPFPVTGTDGILTSADPGEASVLK